MVTENREYNFSPLKTISTILGSFWLMPITFFFALTIGTRWYAESDQRFANQGHEMHSSFTVIIQSPDDKVIYPVPLKLLPQFSQQGSFFLSKAEGFFEGEQSRYDFKELKRTEDFQEIEVVERKKDGDNTIWSRYQVSQGKVKPVSSKMFYFGYSLAALPYAGTLSFIIFLLGRLLRRFS